MTWQTRHRTVSSKTRYNIKHTTDMIYYYINYICGEEYIHIYTHIYMTEIVTTEG